jgi:hypothetical protein
MFERDIGDWRELGFYCHSDGRVREYQLFGSRSGLQKFAILLRAYVADPRNEMKSEHEHYGPYGLEVMTRPDARMDDHSIHGPLRKLAELAEIVERKLAAAMPRRHRGYLSRKGIDGVVLAHGHVGGSHGCRLSRAVQQALHPTADGRVLNGRGSTPSVRQTMRTWTSQPG